MPYLLPPVSVPLLVTVPAAPSKTTAVTAPEIRPDALFETLPPWFNQTPRPSPPAVPMMVPSLVSVPVLPPI